MHIFPVSVRLASNEVGDNGFKVPDKTIQRLAATHSHC